MQTEWDGCKGGTCINKDHRQIYLDRLKLKTSLPCPISISPGGIVVSDLSHVISACAMECFSVIVEGRQLSWYLGTGAYPAGMLHPYCTNVVSPSVFHTSVHATPRFVQSMNYNKMVISIVSNACDHSNMKSSGDDSPKCASANQITLR